MLVKNNQSSDDEPYQIGLENLRVMVYQQDYLRNI